MARPTLYTEKEILNAAASVFIENGYAASTRHIAKVVGLSQPALIQKFGSKKNLFQMAIMPEPVDIEWIIKGDSKAQNLAHSVLLTRLAGRLYQQISTRVPRLLLLQLSPETDPEFIEAAHNHIGVPSLIDALSAHLKQIMGRMVDEHEIPDLVETLMLAAHGATLMKRAGANSDAIKLRLEAVGTFIDGQLNKD